MKRERLMNAKIYSIVLICIIINIFVFSTVSAEPMKKGGICFRVDDNQEIQNWVEYADVFNRYHKHFTAALNFYGIYDDQQYIQLIHNLQAHGHEIADHTPVHVANTFFADSSYVGLPGVDHVHDRLVCLSFNNVTTTSYNEIGTVSIFKNKITSRFPGGFAKTQFTTLPVAIYLPETNKVYVIKEWLNKSGSDTDTLEVTSFWEEDLSHSTDNHEDVPFEWLGSYDVNMNVDGLTLLAQNALDLADIMGIERPYTFIQPGAFPCLKKEEVKASYGTKGYLSGAVYPNNSNVVFNEYDPTQANQYAMMWGGFYEDSSTFESIKHKIADSIAKHYCLIGHSHFRDLLGSWNDYLVRMDSLLQWCDTKNIPVYTHVELANQLFGEASNPYVNIIPALNVDNDNNQIPDGYTLGLTNTNGILDTHDGVNGDYSYYMDNNNRWYLSYINHLAGLEKGNNDLIISTKGTPGNKIIVCISYPEISSQIYTYEFPASSSNWQTYSLAQTINGNHTLFVPVNATFADVRVRVSNYMGGSIKYSNLQIMKKNPAHLNLPPNVTIAVDSMKTVDFINYIVLHENASYDTLHIEIEATPNTNITYTSDFQYIFKPLTNQNFDCHVVLKDGHGHVVDEGSLHIAIDNSMYIGTIDVTQPTIGYIHASQHNQVVLRFNIKTHGNLNAISCSSFLFNTGQTTNVSDLIASKLFSTGQSPVFEENGLINQQNFDSLERKNLSRSLIAGVDFAMNADAVLSMGDNYFWLAYDISTDPFIGDYVDAALMQVATNISSISPPNGNPEGIRTIAGYVALASQFVVAQASDMPVSRGSVNAQILKLCLNVTESIDANIAAHTVKLTSLNCNVLTNVTSDVNNAKLYFTHYSSEYSTQELIGSICVPISDTQVLFSNIECELRKGENYIWLAYDIAEDATENSTVDAQLPIDAIFINGQPLSSTIMSPPGLRTIIDANYNSGNNQTQFYCFINSLSTMPFAPEYRWIDLYDPIELTQLFTASSPIVGGQEGIPIGFEFPFFGNIYNSIWVSKDGFLTLSNPLYTVCEDTSIPSPSGPNNLIALYWDNLYIGEGSKIYYQDIISRNQRCIVFTYDHVRQKSNQPNITENWITAQVLLYEDGTILMQYNSYGSEINTASGIVGIEDQLGTKGLKYCCKGEGAPVFCSGPGPGPIAVEYKETNDNSLVQLNEFTRSYSDATTVFLKWQTESEWNLLGYNLYGCPSQDMFNALRLNNAIISAKNINCINDYEYVLPHFDPVPLLYIWLQVVSMNGLTQNIGPYPLEYSNSMHTTVPIMTTLLPCYPNPFNAEVMFHFDLAKKEKVKLSIYDVKGRLVKQIIDSEMGPGKDFKLVWDGMNRDNVQVASGMYFCRFETLGYSKVAKVILLK